VKVKLFIIPLRRNAFERKLYSIRIMLRKSLVLISHSTTINGCIVPMLTSLPLINSLAEITIYMKKGGKYPCGQTKKKTKCSQR